MSRFTLDGRSKARWLASAPSNTSAPTQAELTAGTDLTGTDQAEELFDIQGFRLEPSNIPMSGYASNKEGTLAGTQSVPQSTMSFYKDDTVEVIYSLLVENASGYIALCFDGLGDGEEVDLYQADVASRFRDPGRNVAHFFVVTFSLTAPIAGTQAA